VQIRIDTEFVKETGRRLGTEANRLAQIGRELENAIDNLDTWAWDGASRARSEPMFNRARAGGKRVAQQLDRLGRQLMRVANVFEQEDNAAARNLAGMPWVDFGIIGAAGIRTGDGLGWDYDRGLEFRERKGELFSKGKGDRSDIHYNDVNQGSVGDCYLLASLAAITKHDPEHIRDMVKDNEDGTYTVRFYEDGDVNNPVDVTVDATFPVEKEERRCWPDGYRDKGATSTDEKELWPSIVEKAYAKWKGGYSEIDGGVPTKAMRELTGAHSYSLNVVESSKEAAWSTICREHERGNPITIAIAQDDKALNLKGEHGYMVERVDIDKNRIYLYNPWGHTHPNPISIDDLVGNATDDFTPYVSVSQLNAGPVDSPIPGGPMYA
jgi:WXG100 family type VII secretion target